MNAVNTSRRGPGNSRVTGKLDLVEVNEHFFVRISDYSSEASARGALLNAASKRGMKITVRKQNEIELLVRRIK